MDNKVLQKTQQIELSIHQALREAADLRREHIIERLCQSAAPSFRIRHGNRMVAFDVLCKDDDCECHDITDPWFFIRDTMGFVAVTNNDELGTPNTWSNRHQFPDLYESL